MRRSVKNMSFIFCSVVLAAAIISSCDSSKKHEHLSLTLQKEITVDGNATVFRGGRLENSNGVPVINLTGTSYDMGLAYGVLLRKPIHEICGELEEIKNALISSRGFFERLAAPVVLKWYISKMRKRIPQEYLEELRGVADGSGIDEDILAFSAVGAGIFAKPMEDAPPHCTSILARLPDRIIHGRNFDFFPAIMAKYPVIVHYKPVNGFAYWNFGVIGFMPSFHGISEKGISVTLNYGVASYHEESEEIPTCYKIRKLLETCGNLDEVTNMLSGIHGDEPGWMLTVESAEEGKGTVFDIMGPAHASSAFTEPEYKMVLNREFSYERYPDGDLARKHLNISDATGEYNVARFDSATKYLKNNTIKSVDGMIDFLRLTDFYGYEIIENRNATIANDHTLHTLIFDWKNKAVYFARGLAYSSLHAIDLFDLTKDTLTKYRDADPRMSLERYRKFAAQEPEVQLHFAADDRKWFVERTDFETAEPYQLMFNIESWSMDPRIVSRDVLLRSAERLIRQYPDYNLPYALKAWLFEKENPREAIALYRKAMSSRIVFELDKIEHLSQIVELYGALGEKENVKASATEFVNLIEEMRRKYAVDRWMEEMEKDMKKLAAGK